MSFGLVGCSRDGAVKVYLLRIDSGRPIFYAEGPDGPAEDGAGAPRRGLRGWLERTSRRWHEAGQDPQEGVGGRLRRAWDWLQRRLAPDEAMLKHLGRADRIELHHPASLAAPEALGLWREYLVRRRRRHGFWLAVTLLLSPLTVLLTPIPGPNLIGYWFVYRAVCHLSIVRGVGRALGEQVPTRLHPTTALELGPGIGPGEWIARVARHYRLPRLGEFLERSTAARQDAVRAAHAEVPGPSAPREPAGSRPPGPCEIGKGTTDG
jgi:hypothetical protein